MLHVPALPGSPANTLPFESIREWVLRDAAALAGGGFDGLILENFGDHPFYPGRVPPHTVAWLAVLAQAVRAAHGIALGINVLRNDAVSALAIAAAAGAGFIRVNVFTGARLTDQGIIAGEAHRLLRYRRTLGARVAILADVAVKHSAALAERSLEDEVEETLQRGLADAVIVTGSGTGKPASLGDVRRAKAAAGDAPVFAGSGVGAGNAAAVLAAADGIIVGTALKKAGRAANPVDGDAARAFARAARSSLAGA
jgi:hypothetical protein